MSMYDVLNNEQVKCFGWHSYDANPIVKGHNIEYHGGSLEGFVTGDHINYRALNYNYTRNFMIMDTSPEQDDTEFILHVIQDGILQPSVTDKNPDPNFDAYFATNSMVIDYYGNVCINIGSYADAIQYAKERKAYEQEVAAHRTKSSKFFKEYSHAIHGIGVMNHESQEYREKRAKAHMYRDLYHKALEEEKPALHVIREKFENKWYAPLPHPMENKLGTYLSAWENLVYAVKNSRKDSLCKSPADLDKFRNDFRSEFPHLSVKDIEAYHAWHESGDKERKEINAMLNDIMK